MSELEKRIEKLMHDVANSTIGAVIYPNRPKEIVDEVRREFPRMSFSVPDTN